MQVALSHVSEPWPVIFQRTCAGTPASAIHVNRAWPQVVPAGARTECLLFVTHEEYREARDMRPVLVSIQQGVNPEPQQDKFIREVRRWEKRNSHQTLQRRSS